MHLFHMEAQRVLIFEELRADVTQCSLSCGRVHFAKVLLHAFKGHKRLATYWTVLSISNILFRNILRFYLDLIEFTNTLLASGDRECTDREVVHEI